MMIMYNKVLSQSSTFLYTHFFLCRSVVYLEIDNRKCSQSSGDCFSNTDEVASFIAAAHIKADLPYPLMSVNSSKLFRDNGISGWNFQHFAFFICLKHSKHELNGRM